MTLGERIAALFQLEGKTWERHANPWSVWSRTTVLPFLILAAWSRVWIGMWAALPGAAALLWTWFNPRIFGPPESLDHWASRAVLGERRWVQRENEPIPEHHQRVPHVLNGVSGLGMIIVVWGVVQLAVWPTLFGSALVYAGKLWYLDRMVWLYRDVQDSGGTPP